MQNSFNATALIPHDKNGKRLKKVSQFLDNKNIELPKDWPKPTRGRNARTLLPVDLLSEFLIWLTPKTRKAILEGVRAEEIINNIRDYW